MALVLFCGQSSYPRNDSATANRYQAIAEMTADLGHEVVFVNRLPALQSGENSVPARFTVINVSGEVRSPSWLKRQILRQIAPFRELFAIVELHKLRHVSFINIYSQFSVDLLAYYFLAKILRAECILHVVEHRSQFSGRGFFFRVNDILFEALMPRMFKKFIAIGGFLQKLIIEKNATAAIALIPPVSRFDLIEKIPKIRSERPYFLYCASLAYEDVAWFVIEAFLSLKEPNVDLVLVLSGNLSARIREASSANGSIKIYSRLDYDVLIGMYKGAYALLIPLRDTAQDCARYPQKITEYLASGRPIISCSLGEIGSNFTNDIDALLSEHYDVGDYANTMRRALDFPERLEEIAKRGHTLGMNMFDVSSQKIRLKGLLS